MMCCVGTCTNQAVLAVRFYPRGVHKFEYCRYHGLSRDGTGYRWPAWQIVEVERIG